MLVAGATARNAFEGETDRIMGEGRLVIIVVTVRGKVMLELKYFKLPVPVA